MLSSLEPNEQHKVHKSKPNKKVSDTPFVAPVISAARCLYAHDGGRQQLETVEQKGAQGTAGRRLLKLGLMGVWQRKYSGKCVREDDASARKRHEDTAMQPRKRVPSAKHPGTL